MNLQHTIKAIIRKGESLCVAESVEIAVVTQRKTLGETIKNLQEAAKLYLQGGNLTEHGLAPNPTLIATMELDPVRTLG